MKNNNKIVIFIQLIILIVFTVCACSENNFTPPITVEYKDGDLMLAMVDYENELILKRLNGNGWINDVSNCGHDYTLTINHREILYHSECGTFTDVEKGRCLTVPEHERLEINSSLENALSLFRTDDTSEPPHSVAPVTLRLLRFNWDGRGISYKDISVCDLCYYLIDSLSDMEETGESVQKISDDTVDQFTGYLPVAPGTVWIEANGKIYRLSPDLSQISRVDTHLGAGKILEMNEEFISALSDILYYYPYDFYVGNYENGELDISHRYSAESDIHFHVKNIEIKNSHDSNNSITLEVISKSSDSVDIRILSQQSDDNRYSEDVKKVSFSDEKSKTVTLDFTGSIHNYQITVIADNTRLVIHIKP